MRSDAELWLRISHSHRENSDEKGMDIHMAFLQFIAFAAGLFFIAYRLRETLVDVIPAAVSALVFLLYGLAFFNSLSLSDYLGLFWLAGFSLWLWRIKKEGRRQFFDFCKEESRKPGTFLAVFLLAVIPLLTSGKTVTWWDDYNFWATDAKAIYYLDGFAGKYQNAAPEFGDYPPGIQMIKWWFLHLNPESFQEGLMYAGYYFMNLAYLAPLLKWVKKKNPFVMVLAAAALWLFPTSAEVFGCDGSCADLTMALIYGCFLMAVWDRKGHGALFYYGRQGLLLGTLVLCKNTGFLWAGFGLLFAYGYYGICVRKKVRGTAGGTAACKGLGFVTLFPVLAELSWLFFCLMNRRVAKLTGAAVQMATGGMNVPKVREELVQTFFEAFAFYPLHRWKTLAIDLTPLSLFLLLLFLTALLYRRKFLEKKQAVWLFVFFCFSGLFFYTMNLISHLTIFATEVQYLEPFSMVSSIERYGAPFTIGGLYLTAYLVLKNGRRGLWWCMLFVFLTCDYASGYRAAVGYKSAGEAELEKRAEILDERADAFLEEIGAGERKNEKRVLYIRDIEDVSWVRNTYINYGAAPVSVIHANIDGETMESGALQQMLEDSHAGYLYADPVQGGDSLWEALTQGEKFEYGRLYEIQKSKQGLLLVKAEG